MYVNFFRKLYWTNWNGKHPSIQTSFLTGWDMKSIITDGIRTPNGLTIDHKAEKLYWSDARLDKIERCNYDGSKREVSLSRPFYQHKLFALSCEFVLFVYLYFSFYIGVEVIAVGLVTIYASAVSNMYFFV